MVPGERLAHLYKFSQGVLSNRAVKFYPRQVLGHSSCGERGSVGLIRQDFQIGVEGTEHGTGSIAGQG